MTKARSHVAWTASARAIDRLKAVDKAVRGTGSKPRGGIVPNVHPQMQIANIIYQIINNNPYQKGGPIGIDPA